MTDLVTGHDKLYAVKIAGDKHNPLVVTGNHILVLRRHRSETAAFNVPAQIEDLAEEIGASAKRAGTGAEIVPDATADGAKKQGGHFFFRDEAHLKKGMLAHLFSLDREPKQRKHFANCLIGKTGVRPSKNQVVFRRHLDNVQYDKSFSWKMTEAQRLATIKKRKADGTYDEDWDPVICTDEVEAYDKLVEWTQEMGYAELPELDLDDLQRKLDAKLAYVPVRPSLPRA